MVFTLRSPNQNSARTTPVSHTSTISLSLIWSTEQYLVMNRPIDMKLLVCSFLHFPVTLFFLGSNISTPCSWKPSVDVSSSVWETRFQSHTEQPDKIRVLHTLIFIIFYSKLEDLTFCTGWQHALPDFSLHLMYSWMEFWFVKDFENVRTLRSINVFITYIYDVISSELCFQDVIIYTLFSQHLLVDQPPY
jgi:hypothetical protein